MNPFVYSAQEHERLLGAEEQAVNMTPLGWVPSARGGAGDQGSNQTRVPGEGGNGDPNRNPADDPAPGV